MSLCHVLGWSEVLPSIYRRFIIQWRDLTGWEWVTFVYLYSPVPIKGFMEMRESEALAITGTKCFIQPKCIV